MAHVEKFKREAVAAMLHHYTRDNDRTLGRSNIDPERTRDNYRIGPCRGRDYIAERIDEVARAQGRAVRSTAVVMCDWVVTAPPDLKPEDRRKFFETCHRFFEDRYGERQMLGSYVHMDETTPHAHIAFMPIKYKDGVPHLTAKEVLSRAELGKVHPELSRAVERGIGYRVQVQLGDDRQLERALSKVDGMAAYQREKDRLERLRQDQRGLEKSNRELEGRARELEREVELARREVDVARRNVERKEWRAESLGREIEATRQVARQRAQKVEQVREQTKESRSRIAELGRKIEQARSRCQELGRRLHELRERARNRMQRPHAERMRENVARVRSMAERADGRGAAPSDELKRAYGSLSRRERAMLHRECPQGRSDAVDALKSERRRDMGYVPHMRENGRERDYERDYERKRDHERDYERGR